MPSDEQNDRDTARNRFLAACSLAGASTTAYRGPGGNGSAEEGQGCWLDIARLGVADASAVLVLCCGLQGMEGFCGSEILTAWLSQRPQPAGPSDIAVVLIHAILPNGMNIGGATAPDDSADRDWSDNVLSAAARRFTRYARSKGLTVDAQPPETDSVDDRTAWLADAFKAVAQEVAEHAGRVGLVEFHTGMRPLGDVVVTSPHAVGGGADSRVMEWFGEASSARNDGPAPLDSFALGFGDSLRTTILTAAHAEFGVYTMKSILQLDARRTAAERHADIDGLFFPKSETWRDSVRETGMGIIDQALRGLVKA